MIYHVYATKSNIGDWLSARGIQSLLKPMQVQELFCDSPYVEETIDVLSKALVDDIIIIGGGGLLMDYFSSFWELFNKNVASHTPFFLWGVGCCDHKSGTTHISRNLISDIVLQSQFCIVRDNLTLEYLKDCGLPKSVPCPSLVVIDRVNCDVKRILYVKHTGLVPSDVNQAIVDVLKEEALKVNSSYIECRNRISPSEDQTLQSELDYYRNSDVIISSRLHGCIIGVGMGKKLIAISGDKKIDDFMISAGLKDWILEFSQIDQLLPKLKNLHSQNIPNEFIRQARLNNLKVSEQIKSFMKNSVI